MRRNIFGIIGAVLLTVAGGAALAQPCAIQEQQLARDQKLLAYSHNAPSMQWSVAESQRQLDECRSAAQAKSDAAAKAAVAQQEASAEAQKEEDRISAIVSSARKDPRVARLIKSRALCNAIEARKEALANIATERKYAKQAGVVDLSSLEDYRIDLQRADETIAEAKCDLSSSHLKSLACSDVRLSEFRGCLDSYSEWDVCGEDFMIAAVSIARGKGSL